MGVKMASRPYLFEVHPDQGYSALYLAYADLLSSGEAAEAIGLAVGYELSETVRTDITSDAPIINASVIGPSADDAKRATEAAFAWLANKIEQPLDPQPPVATDPENPEVVLTTPFSTILSVALDESLTTVDGDVFLLVQDAAVDSNEVAIAVAAQAGSIVSTGAILEANGTIILNLETASGEELDRLRLAPDPLPDTAPAYPRLRIEMMEGSVTTSRVSDDEGNTVTTWVLDESQISTEWIPGTPEVDEATTTEQFQVAMLTDNPTALAIGGRRGPLIGLSVLLVGSILILVAVIIADTWRRERDEEQVGTISGRLSTPADTVDVTLEPPVDENLKSDTDS